MVKLELANAVPVIKVPPVTVIVGAAVYPEPVVVTRFKAVGPVKPTFGATV